MQIALIILVAAAVIALVVWWSKVQAERERQRRAGLRALAVQNGFEFSESDRWDLDSRYEGILDIGRGHDRYALDVVAGHTPKLYVFRYHYKTWETRTVTRNGRTYTEQHEVTHWRQYLIIELNSHFPSLLLRGESFFDKLAGFVGFDDIDFESEAFSKKYFVKSNSKEFAYAMIHPQMMEYLLNLSMNFQLQDGRLVMDLQQFAFDAPGMRDALDAIGGVVNLVPDFVWQDYGKTPPIKLPTYQYTPEAVPTAV